MDAGKPNNSPDNNKLTGGEGNEWVGYLASS